MLWRGFVELDVGASFSAVLVGQVPTFIGRGGPSAIDRQDCWVCSGF